VTFAARAPGRTWTLAGYARIIRPLLSTLFVLCLAAPLASAEPLPLERAVSQRFELARVALERIALPVVTDRPTFTLDLDGESVTVHLEHVSLRAPGFRLLVQGADGALREVRAPAPATFRGTIDGRPGAVVSGTLRDGRLTAAIALPGGRSFYVQPADAAAGAEGLHAVYRGDDAVAGSESCAADGDPEPMPRGGSAAPEASAPVLRIADVAFDADYEFFQIEGSVDATVGDIEAVLAGVNAVYERDCDVSHRIATIVVRTTAADPYEATAGDVLLDELRTYWNASMGGVERDMVHLMTGKDLDGSTIGYANIGAVCNLSRAYGLSRSMYSSNFGKRTTLTAHEMGHNWNAVHCNKTPNISSPCNVMCSTIAGCDGMGMPNFEPQGLEAVTAFAATRTCLTTQVLGVNGPASPAAGLSLEAPWPSPFRDQVSLRFQLGRPGPVRLEVIDLSGRCVARLTDGVFGEGWHTAAWDGRDARGRRVEPGILFVRLAGDGNVITRKLVFAR